MTQEIDKQNQKMSEIPILDGLYLGVITNFQEAKVAI